MHSVLKSRLGPYQFFWREHWAQVSEIGQFSKAALWLVSTGIWIVWTEECEGMHLLSPRQPYLADSQGRQRRGYITYCTSHPESMAIFAPLAARHRYLQHHWDSNSQSHNDRVNILLLHHFRHQNCKLATNLLKNKCSVVPCGLCVSYELLWNVCDQQSSPQTNPQKNCLKL